jgi:aldose 1-epimerase
MNKQFFTTVADNKVAHLYTLRSDKISVQISDYGGTIVSIETPDNSGRKENVVLGFDDFAHYLVNQPYLGAIVGRCCGRIGGARFNLDGKSYQLTQNLAVDHLHSGQTAFHNSLWELEDLSQSQLILKLHSADGTDGYPGNVVVRVIYSVSNFDLKWDCQVTVDEACPINVTNHSYFNLGGSQCKTILDHELLIKAGQILEFSDQLLPTGDYESVDQTACDFRQFESINARRSEISNESFGGGYDHCYVLQADSEKAVHVATLREYQSGRFMEVHTSQRALQLYTGNFLSQCKEQRFSNYAGLCLETQGFPGAVHHPHFGGIVRPGDSYRHSTIYRFGVNLDESKVVIPRSL